MTPLEFCYWLKGYFELRLEQGMTNDQAEVVRDHLELVFKKVTPERKLTQYDIVNRINRCATASIPAHQNVRLCYHPSQYDGFNILPGVSC